MGSGRLRTAITGHDAGVTTECVLATYWAIGSDHLLHSALVNPGAVVVLVVPTFQKQPVIPVALAAEVREIRPREAHGWRLVDQPASAAFEPRPAGYVHPSNPTSVLLDAIVIRRIVAIAGLIAATDLNAFALVGLGRGLVRVLRAIAQEG